MLNLGNVVLSKVCDMKLYEFFAAFVITEDIINQDKN